MVCLSVYLDRNLIFQTQHIRINTTCARKCNLIQSESKTGMLQPTNKI